MKCNYTWKKIESLVRSFDDQSLSRHEWTHDAHLIVAFWYVRNFGFFEAICRIKSGIMLLNCAHFTSNTGNSGYHETLTVFWTKLISIYIDSFPELSLEQQLNDFLGSNLSSPHLPLDFYSKQSLMRMEYRALFKEPLIESLDKLTVSRKLLATNK